MSEYTEEEVLRSYKGRCICNEKEGGLGYIGSCSIKTHRIQMADPNTWVHTFVSKWIEEACYTADSSHTDPGEIKTALALAEKKLARAEKLNKVMYNALGKIKTIAGTIEGKGTLQASDIWNIIARVPTQAADKHLKDVLMPDKK